MKRWPDGLQNTVPNVASDFVTVEEPLDLAGAIRSLACDAIVVDCLTLWLSNTMSMPDKDANEDHRGGVGEHG